MTAQTCPRKFLVFREALDLHARTAVSHNLQERVQDIVLVFLVRGENVLGP